MKEEKALSRAKAALAKKRRALPWVKVKEDYVFEDTRGSVKLSELFSKEYLLNNLIDFPF